MDLSDLGKLNRTGKLWDYLTYQLKVGKHLPQFRKKHELLVVEAHQRPPQTRGRNVTDFANWLYELYTKAPNPESIARGIALEPLVEKKRLASAKFRENYSHSQWKLLYRGMGENPDPALKISSLRVNEDCLWGRPDLVFKHQKKGDILILEIKISNASLPDEGWPNLRGQLWAYSHADEFADAPRVFLAGEVWRDDLSNGYPIRMPLHDQSWRQQNEELFRAYGGEIV